MSITPITQRRRYHKATPKVWALIRDGFETGYPVALLARHYGPVPSTIYRRVAEENWRRPNAVDPAPLPALPAHRVVSGELESAASDGGPETLADAIEKTVELAVAAVREGRTESAAALATLAERLMRLQARRGEEEPQVFTPARDIISVLAERFGVEPRP